MATRQLAPADFHGHDWLLCADASVLRDVDGRRPPGAPARSVLMLDWAWPEGGPRGRSGGRVSQNRVGAAQNCGWAQPDRPQAQTGASHRA